MYTDRQVARQQLSAHRLAARLRPRGNSPLHTQLESGLRELIHSGEVPVGTELPAELDLAAELGLSRHTIRQALTALVSEGLLLRERGRGTRVLAGVGESVTERSLAGFYAFAWELSARGLEQRSYVLERNRLAASPELAQRLALPVDALVERIVRVRTANNDPLVLETAYLPAELAGPLDVQALGSGSIYDFLENYFGLRVVRAHERIQPIVLSRSVASLLSVRPGSAAFRVERTTWSDRGPVEWQESVLRGDRYLYSVELPRGGRSGSAG
jgi:GntR family transcriptional regulator